MTSNNKTNRTVEKNMDRIMELLSKLRFYGMFQAYRKNVIWRVIPNYVFTVCLKHTEMTVGQHPLMV